MSTRAPSAIPARPRRHRAASRRCRQCGGWICDLGFCARCDALAREGGGWAGSHT